MGAQGSTTVDFGAFPGGQSTTVAVTGQASIIAGSLVEAWVMPVASSNHSADEHIIDPPVVMAGNVVAGTGFTIYANARNFPNAPLYGTYTVEWVWN